MTVQVPIKSLNLQQLFEQIKPHMEAIDRAEAAALGHAKSAGRWLKLAKSRCRAENWAWNAWVASKFPKSKRMADNYIRIYDHWHELEAHMQKTGEALTVSKALAVLSKSKEAADPAGEQEQASDPPPKKRVKLNDAQRDALTAFLAARQPQDPVAFVSVLTEWGVNPKMIESRLEEIVADKEADELQQWLDNLNDCTPAWSDACDPFGVEPDLMAWFAASKVLDEVVPFDPYDPPEGRQEYANADQWTLMAVGGDGTHYLVANNSFNPDRMARRVAEWLLQNIGHVPDIDLDDEQLSKLEQALAARSTPANALPPTEGQAVGSSTAGVELPPTEAPPAEMGPAGAMPPTAEPPAPRKKRK